MSANRLCPPRSSRCAGPLEMTGAPRTSSARSEAAVISSSHRCVRQPSANRSAPTSEPQHNLPRERTRLFGRDQDIEQCLQLLQHNRAGHDSGHWRHRQDPSGRPRRARSVRQVSTGVCGSWISFPSPLSMRWKPVSPMPWVSRCRRDPRAPAAHRRAGAPRCAADPRQL